MSTDLFPPAERLVQVQGESVIKPAPSQKVSAKGQRSGANDRPRSHVLVPSLPDLVYLGWALVLVTYAPVILLNRDGDLPRHIATGRVMLDKRSLPTADYFSHTRFGDPYLAYEWLSQFIFAAVHELGAIPAVAALSAAVIAAAYALLLAFLLRRGVNPLHALITLVAASALGLTHWAARPHMFSFLACALLLPLLVPSSTRRAWLALPLFAVWANLHPGFIYGLGLLAIVLAGDVIEMFMGADRTAWSSRTRFHAIALLCGAVGSLLTPYGIDLHLHVVGHAGSSWMADQTTEFMAPDFHTLAGQIFLAALLGVLAIVALRSKRLDAPSLLLLLVTVAAALYSRRNIALFGVVTLPLLATAMPGSGSRLSLGVLQRIGSTLAMGQRLARQGIWAGAATLLLAGFALAGGQALGRQLVVNELSDRTFPAAAVAAARDAGLEGNLFNHFMWGGYLTLYWPEQRIFIDGFSDFYGEAVFRDYLHIASLQPGWRATLARWRIAVALLPVDSPLAHALAGEPEWRERYRDDIAVLLQRSVPGSSEAVDQ
jgi:hypothetical protein